MPSTTSILRTVQLVKASVQNSHTIKLSLSLALLVMCVLFSADLLSLRGNPDLIRQNARKAVAESLAVQLSTLAAMAEQAALQYAVSEFVSRNQEVLAVALFPQEGAVLASSGDTRLLFASADNQSAVENMSVPLYEGQRLWGEVKLAFRPERRWQGDVLYFSFLACSCLFVFFIFLRRVLMQLDPSKAVPGRVDSAFNLFTEGVVIMDDKLRILLTNNSASNMIAATPESQIGKSLDDWPWIRDDQWYSPWREALRSGMGGTEHHLYLDATGGQRSIVANCILVGEEESELRGVMVTLTDMSDLHRKNHELSTTLRQLEASKQAIANKNKELETLASTDPLSGLLNRRSLMLQFEALCEKTVEHDQPLACMMLDIDHFKKINDTHGHKVGDDVIHLVAQCLKTNARETDVVARYGGEEFVIVLPDTTRQQAEALAERLRQEICNLADGDALPLERLSASIGLSEVEDKAGGADVQKLLDRADQALYAAKESGRNRVVFYDEDTLALMNASKQLSSESINELQQQSLEKTAQQSNPEIRLVAHDALSGMPAGPAELVKSIIDKHYLELEMVKSHDLLTNLPKRQLFMQAVENEIYRARRNQTIMAVVSIEIRDFIRFTASLGHEKSDQLIKEIVENVKEGLRISDSVAAVDDKNNLSHLTDNQFGILLCDLADVDHMLPVLTRLRRLLTDPVVLDEQTFHMGFNMGIAIYPECGNSAADLLESAADARMRASAMPDKVAYHFASSDVAEKSRAYLALESDLYEAVARRSLTVHYQPKFDLKNRSVTGVEALVRWFHDERGFVPPDQFIPLAETNGLVSQIFQQVLELSLAQLIDMKRRGLPAITMAVNLSGAQLRDKTLVEDVLAALSAAGVGPGSLELELTETTIIQSPVQARRTLGVLHDAGVNVSMDDFGTGYTSLGLLAELPLSCVKLDRSFVNAMQANQRSQAIVESVIRMAHALGLRVVAEGVETPEQLESLDRLGCDLVQGYLISRPLSGEELVRLLSRETLQILPNGSPGRSTRAPRG